MRYSLLAGGKRIRPVLLMKFCEAAGGTLEQALDAACGVEMLHTYSLIHDDLPCMDNDDLRRGKPTCHKVFGACTATLAGDALQAAAFEAVLTSPQVDERARARMALVLSKAVGSAGMCLGQYLDMDAEGRQPSLEELSAIHRGKTAALLRAACQMGVLAAGIRQETEVLLETAGQYAEHLGLAFQIQDDLLDVTSTTEELGKPVGSDSANGKRTFVTLLGQDACVRMVEEQTCLARQALAHTMDDSGFLCWLADELAGRTH
jgi:geranylgeranyl pyrophosphate synthase